MADVIQPPVQGLIAHFNLADWWLSAFSAEERDWIESERSKGTLTIGQANPRPLTTGTFVQMNPAVTMHSLTSTNLLHEIACAVYRRSREKALGVFHKAEEDGLSKLHLHPKYIVDLHFVYHSMIELNYRDREQFRDALEIAVGACRKQIALAPRGAEVFKREWKLIPRPVGFWQLAVILESRGTTTRLSRSPRRRWSKDGPAIGRSGSPGASRGWFAKRRRSADVMKSIRRYCPGIHSIQAARSEAQISKNHAGIGCSRSQ